MKKIQIISKIFQASLVMLTGSVLLAQNQNLEFYKKKYPNIGEIILSQSETLFITVKDDKLDISSNSFEESYIIDEDVQKRRSIGGVPYSTFQEIKEIQAFTLVPSGNNKFKKIEIKDFKIVPDRNSRTFHDDYKLKQFDYPQLSLGAKKTLAVTKNFPEPRLISGEMFMAGFPVEHKEFSVMADKSVDLGYKVFNNEKQKIQFSKEEKNGKILYKWTAKDIPKFAYEEKTPSPLYYAPMVEVYIKSYTTKKGDKKMILNSLEDLHRLYTHYIKDVGVNPDKEMVNLANTLKQKHTNELDQVKEIYYWVKNNIKYIAFEDGYGGFIPRNSNDVFTKRYGDCKDMSAIIYTMMKSAGIKNVYLTWIGSRDKPFKYDDIPTQMVDDHMIVTYQNNGKNYFLDGTSRETPFGYPTSFIQGKQALLHKDADKYELVTVPVFGAEKSVREDKINLVLQESKIVGKAVTELTGYERDNFLYTLQDKSGFQRTSFLKEYLELGSNKFIIEKSDIENRENRESPLKINYDFSLDNYAITAGNEIYINLALNKLDDIKTLDEKRQYDYEIDNTYTYSSVTKIDVPKGYKVTSLPKNTKMESPEFSYQIEYSKKPESVEMMMKVSINYLILKKENISKWNTFVNSLNESMSESISIQKN